MRRLVTLLTAEAAVTGLVHRLAQPHWSVLRRDAAGLLHAPTGDLVVAALHVTAWLAAWWLLLGTGHDLVMVVGDRRTAGLRTRRRMAPMWVQRVLQQAVGSVLVLGVVAGPAAAATAAAERPVGVTQVVAPPVPIVASPTSAGDVEVPIPPGGDAMPADGPAGGAVGDDDIPPAGSAAADVPTPDVAAAEHPQGAGPHHVVAAGENLWVIARQHLTVVGGATPGDREVHAHWVRLIQANRDVLRSGDPDVIFPGEQLRLPPMAPGGEEATP